MAVGLCFAILTSLASFFKDLELPLHICTLNTICILLCVNAINNHLWLQIGAHTILDYYQMVVIQQTIHCTPNTGQSLVDGIDYLNNYWADF